MKWYTKIGASVACLGLLLAPIALQASKPKSSNYFALFLPSDSPTVTLLLIISRGISQY